MPPWGASTGATYCPVRTRSRRLSWLAGRSNLERSCMNERTTLEIIAPTVEEALAQGLAQLGLPADAVSVEVLDSGNKGLFGLGGRQVRVRLSVNPPGGPPVVAAAPAPEIRLVPSGLRAGRKNRQPRARRRNRPRRQWTTAKIAWPQVAAITGRS